MVFEACLFQACIPPLSSASTKHTVSYVICCLGGFAAPTMRFKGDSSSTELTICMHATPVVKVLYSIHIALLAASSPFYCSQTVVGMGS